jgi:hypothetical protein
MGQHDFEQMGQNFDQTQVGQEFQEAAVPEQFRIATPWFGPNTFVDERTGNTYYRGRGNIRLSGNMGAGSAADRQAANMMAGLRGMGRGPQIHAMPDEGEWKGGGSLAYGDTVARNPRELMEAIRNQMNTVEFKQPKRGGIGGALGGMGGGIVGGLVGAALAPATGGMSLLIPAALGAAGGGLGTVLGGTIAGEPLDWKNIGINTAAGFGGSLLGGGLGRLGGMAGLGRVGSGALGGFGKGLGANLIGGGLSGNLDMDRALMGGVTGGLSGGLGGTRLPGWMKGMGGAGFKMGGQALQGRPFTDTDIMFGLTKGAAGGFANEHFQPRQQKVQGVPRPRTRGRGRGRRRPDWM